MGGVAAAGGADAAGEVVTGNDVLAAGGGLAAVGVVETGVGDVEIGIVPAGVAVVEIGASGALSTAAGAGAAVVEDGALSVWAAESMADDGAESGPSALGPGSVAGGALWSGFVIGYFGVIGGGGV